MCHQCVMKKLNFKIEIPFLGISTQNKDTLTPLKKELLTVVQSLNSSNGIVITNTRHFHALSEALIALNKVKEGLDNDLPGDLLSIELKEAIYHVGAITGVIDHDHDILGTIFSQFCIGK